MSERLTKDIEMAIDALTGGMKDLADQVVSIHQNDDQSFHDSMCDMFEQGSITVDQCKKLAIVFDTYWD